MSKSKFKSLKEIDKILKSKKFKKQADLIEKQNRELLASTKIDRNKLNDSFDI